MISAAAKNLRIEASPFVNWPLLSSQPNAAGLVVNSPTPPAAVNPVFIKERRLAALFRLFVPLFMGISFLEGAIEAGSYPRLGQERLSKYRENANFL
jgi:hypothetical protein